MSAAPQTLPSTVERVTCILCGGDSGPDDDRDNWRRVEHEGEWYWACRAHFPSDPRDLDAIRLAHNRFHVAVAKDVARREAEHRLRQQQQQQAPAPLPPPLGQSDSTPPAAPEPRPPSPGTPGESAT